MEFLVKIIKHEVVTIPVEADDASEAEEIAFRLASNDKIDPPDWEDAGTEVYAL